MKPIFQDSFGFGNGNCAWADPRNYFQSAAEANEWLDFEEDSEEHEVYFWRYNDQYHEWENWRRAWLDRDVLLVVDSEVIHP